MERAFKIRLGDALKVSAYLNKTHEIKLEEMRSSLNTKHLKEIENSRSNLSKTHHTKLEEFRSTLNEKSSTELDNVWDDLHAKKKAIEEAQGWENILKKDISRMEKELKELRVTLSSQRKSTDKEMQKMKNLTGLENKLNAIMQNNANLKYDAERLPAVQASLEGSQSKVLSLKKEVATLKKANADLFAKRKNV